MQVYTDGTVLVTHGGVEMGQGLHTKIAQIAASSFNIPISSVFISETSTDKVIKQGSGLVLFGLRIRFFMDSLFTICREVE